MFSSSHPRLREVEQFKLVLHTSWCDLIMIVKRPLKINREVCSTLGYLVFRKSA